MSTQVESIVPNIGISEKACQEVGGLLNRIVADEFLLATNAHNYFFNVLGPRSYHLRELFKDQSKVLFANEIEISENIRQLGHRVPTFTEKLKLARLPQPPTEWLDAQQMVKRLLTDEETFIQNLCQDTKKVREVGDESVEDFLIDLIRSHKQLAYLLRSHLDRPEVKQGQQGQQQGFQGQGQQTY